VVFLISHFTSWTYGVAVRGKAMFIQQLYSDITIYFQNKMGIYKLVY